MNNFRVDIVTAENVGHSRFLAFIWGKKNNLFVYFSLPIYNAITLLLLSLLLLSRVKLRRQARGC